MINKRNNINYTYTELIDYIEGLGWELDRHSKHAIYKHPRSSYHISIPHRKVNGMSKGMINKILKQSEKVLISNG